MNTPLRSLAVRGIALGSAFVALSLASAGTFKHITIDGSFSDWAGVPAAAADDEGDASEGFDLREIYVANDDQYLYFRVRIYPSSTNPDYTKFHHHFYIDSDNNQSTGFGGTEMAVEDGYAFSQRYGVNWSDGDVTGLNGAQAPQGPLPTFEYEYRVSRSVRDVQPADVPPGSGNPARDLPVFTQDLIGIEWDVLTASWSSQDAGPAFTYEMAPAPPPFSGTQTLIDLTTASWQVNDTATDLGTEWLAMDYDDMQMGWKSGTGLFGFNAPGGVYPAPVSTTLTSGGSTYYFRSRFAWNYDQNGAGLLVSNYLSAGAVFYVNGAEVRRLRMPTGTVGYSTPATGGPAQPGTPEIFEITSSALLVGDNLLEVEVHALAGTPGSLVFGLALIASDSLPPRIEDPSQPADRSVIEGQATTFSPGVISGTGPFTYQWFKGSTAITDATSLSLTMDPVVETNAGSYSIEITNPKGAKTTSRAAVLTTTAVPVALADPNQPADQTVAEGMSATFTVTITGSLPVLQWYKGNEPIEGANGPQLVLTNLTLNDSGTHYSVTVTNRLNSVTSRLALLTVVRDATGPGLTGAAGGGRTVVVTFSEQVDATSAQLASNYTLDGGVQVQSAVLNTMNGDTVTLRTTAQAFGRPYQITATGVKDLFGNPSASSAWFQSSILIDGNFEDWESVPVASTQDQVNPGTIEFKEVAITNDTEFIYVRFSFYAPAGPLAAAEWATLGNYWQVVFDTDANPATGTFNGGEVLDEVNTLLRLGGGWTDGAYNGANGALAPAEVTGSNFELRVSLKAVHERDGLPAFPNASMAVFCVIRNTSWSELDNTLPAVPYTLGTLPPMPPMITVKRVGSKLELTWPGGGELQTRSSLSAGEWTPVTGGASGIQVDPLGAGAGTAAYYRVKQ